MKNEISNRFNMTATTVTFCDGHTAETATVTEFAMALGVVKGKIVLINGLNQVGEGTTTGVTLDTNLLRKTMTTMALKCAYGTNTTKTLNGSI